MAANCSETDPFAANVTTVTSPTEGRFLVFVANITTVINLTERVK
jgi:hypothetical protein